MGQILLNSISLEELQHLISLEIKPFFNDLKGHFQPKQPTEYLTRQEVAEMLKIDLSTVHNWTKKGTLTSYGIGGRVYYKRQEVEDAIIQF